MPQTSPFTAGSLRNETAGRYVKSRKTLILAEYRLVLFEVSGSGDLHSGGSQ